YLRGIIGGPFAKLPKSQPNTPTAPHRLPSRPCAEPHRSAELPCEHHGEGQRSLTSHSSPLDDLSDGLRQFSNSSATSKAAGRSLVATASLSSLPVGSTRAASDPNLIVVCEQLPAILRRKRWDADDFDVLDKCHSGYASAVYRAQCRLSGQLVALKVYQPSKLHVISQFQLQREARLQAAMRHPNIIRLYAAFKYRECVVLVQEWADGGDLLQHLLQHNTRMSEQQATNVVLLPLLRAAARPGPQVLSLAAKCSPGLGTPCPLAWRLLIDELTWLGSPSAPCTCWAR
ncbi:protein kinase domain-containing protein, partial [Haematococcus lacustris]